MDTRSGLWSPGMAPAKHLCQECGLGHKPGEPHDPESLHYQLHFHTRNGRLPTWTDAMAHCLPDVRQVFGKLIVRVLPRHGLQIPRDLL